MKNKKVLRLSLIGAGAMGIAFAMTAVIGHNTGLFVGKGFDGHTADCEWNHYEAYKSNFVHSGSKEFWACCTHPGNHVLTEPESTHITDMGPYKGYLDSADDRYTAPLPNNHYLHIDVTDMTSTPAAYSKESWEGLRTIKFKARITGGKQEGKNTWWGFGANASASADVYTGMHVASGVPYDGEWHDVTINLGDTDGYFYFINSVDEFTAGSTIDIDDIELGWYWDNHFAYDDFENGSALFNLQNRAVILSDHVPGVEIKPQLASYASAPLYTTNRFTKIMEFSAEIKVVADASDNWWGFGISTSHQFYGGDMNSLYKMDGDVDEFKTYRFWRPLADDLTYWRLMVDGVDSVKEINWGYQATDIAHIAVISSDKNVSIIIRNFKLVAEEGSFTETFGNGFGMFTADYGACEIVDTTPENGGPSQINDIGVVALDVTTTTVAGRNYSPVITTSTGTDATYGPYLQLDDWACAASQNRCMFGMSSTRKLSAIIGDLEDLVDSYFFYMYNPLTTDFNLQLLCENSYYTFTRKTLTAQAWTRIELRVGVAYTEESSGNTITISEAHQISLDHSCSANGESCGQGFKISNIYAKAAEPVNPQVNPAPFGVVAWDAQTGDLRDIKGRSNSADVSHGIDDNYGAYIQADNWKCGASGNLCWLTLSDTAKTVAAIETELGKSITNYFFYVYNPTESDFSFRIMLKSSSAMNPNVNVTCAPGAWTLVTLDYNHADSGSYDPLTSASQIGLDHQCASNGESIGSGWKITSVYAE